MRMDKLILSRPWLGLVPAALFLFVGLDWTVLIDWDENIYAEITRRMVTGGDYLRLYANGQPFAEKPPFYFWNMALWFHVFGMGEYAARFTSALPALVLMVVLYLTGRRLGGRRLGILWAVVYGFSFGPLLSARMAVIDHMFNTLIAIAAILLFFYDEEYGRFRAGEFERARHWLYLLGAAVVMGVAVLTKGPLGGVIPLVAYGSLKFARRAPAVHFGHFAVCGVVALSVALSWYAANYIVQGDKFLEGFAKFQGQLFSKPLDGHDGPFFYHLLVALLGLFPWTPLLWLWRDPARREAIYADGLRGLVFWGLGWLVFVQVLFAFVSTKLPHYSASMYIPLSLFVALALDRLLREGSPAEESPGDPAADQAPNTARISGGLLGVFVGYGILLGVAVGLLPYFMEAANESTGYVFAESIEPPPFAFLTGLFLALAALAGGHYFYRRRLLAGVLAAAVCMGCFSFAFWGLLAPQFSRYNQGPVMSFMKRAYSAGGDLALYRYLSFAAMFYGKKDILVLHSYKFEGDTERLKQGGERDLYVVAPRKTASELQLFYPKLKHLEDRGLLSLWLLPAQSE